jgi:hypothetical protein
VISGHPFILDDELGWKLAPSKTTTHHSLYFDTRYTTNSFGFRDKPRSTAKSDDAYRILLYGDSLIFGWGLNDGERFSDLIENERADENSNPAQTACPGIDCRTRHKRWATDRQNYKS